MSSERFGKFEALVRGRTVGGWLPIGTRLFHPEGRKEGTGEPHPRTLHIAHCSLHILHFPALAHFQLHKPSKTSETPTAVIEERAAIRNSFLVHSRRPYQSSVYLADHCASNQPRVPLSGAINTTFATPLPSDGERNRHQRRLTLPLSLNSREATRWAPQYPR